MKRKLTRRQLRRILLKEVRNLREVADDALNDHIPYEKPQQGLKELARAFEVIKKWYDVNGKYADDPNTLAAKLAQKSFDILIAALALTPSTTRQGAIAISGIGDRIAEDGAELEELIQEIIASLP